MTTLTLKPQTITDEEGLRCGLRQSWIEGEHPTDGSTFDLDCGAGLGSPWLLLTVTLADGTTRMQRVDIRDVLLPWVAAVKQTG